MRFKTLFIAICLMVLSITSYSATVTIYQDSDDSKSAMMDSRFPTTWYTSLPGSQVVYAWKNVTSSIWVHPIITIGIDNATVPAGSTINSINLYITEYGSSITASESVLVHLSSYNTAYPKWNYYSGTRYSGSTNWFDYSQSNNAHFNTTDSEPIGSTGYMAGQTNSAGDVLSIALNLTDEFPQYAGTNIMPNGTQYLAFIFKTVSSGDSEIEFWNNGGADSVRIVVDYTLPVATQTPTATNTGQPTPTFTNTPFNTPTNTSVPPTSTNTPVPPTSTPTNTGVLPTSTPTQTPTKTPTNTPTNTPIPVSTAISAPLLSLDPDTGGYIKATDGILDNITVRSNVLAKSIFLANNVVFSPDSVYDAGESYIGTDGSARIGNLVLASDSFMTWVSGGSAKFSPTGFSIGQTTLIDGVLSLDGDTYLSTTALGLGAEEPRINLGSDGFLNYLSGFVNIGTVSGGVDNNKFRFNTTSTIFSINNEELQITGSTITANSGLSIGTDTTGADNILIIPDELLNLGTSNTDSIYIGAAAVQTYVTSSNMSIGANATTSLFIGQTGLTGGFLRYHTTPYCDFGVNSTVVGTWNTTSFQLSKPLWLFDTNAINWYNSGGTAFDGKIVYTDSTDAFTFVNSSSLATVTIDTTPGTTTSGNWIGVAASTATNGIKLVGATGGENYLYASSNLHIQWDTAATYIHKGLQIYGADSYLSINGTNAYLSINNAAGYLRFGANEQQIKWLDNSGTTWNNNLICTNTTNILKWRTSTTDVATLDFDTGEFWTKSTITTAGALVTTPPAVVAITADNQTITTTNLSLIKIQTTGTNSYTGIVLSAGVNGQRLTLVDVDTGDTIGIADSASVQTIGGSGVSVGPNDVVEFVYTNSIWYQVTPVAAN